MRKGTVQNQTEIFIIFMFWVVTSIYLDVLLHICVFRHDNQLAERVADFRKTEQIVFQRFKPS